MLRLIRVEMTKTGRRRIQLGWDGESRLIGQLGGRHCSEYKCEDEESVGQFSHWVRSNKLEVHHFRCIVERDFVDCLKSSSSFVLKKIRYTRAELNQPSFFLSFDAQTKIVTTMALCQQWAPPKRHRLEFLSLFQFFSLVLST